SSCSISSCSTWRLPNARERRGLPGTAQGALPLRRRVQGAEDCRRDDLSLAASCGAAGEDARGLPPAGRPPRRRGSAREAARGGGNARMESVSKTSGIRLSTPPSSVLARARQGASCTPGHVRPLLPGSALGRVFPRAATPRGPRCPPLLLRRLSAPRAWLAASSSSPSAWRRSTRLFQYGGPRRGERGGASGGSPSNGEIGDDPCGVFDDREQLHAPLAAGTAEHVHGEGARQKLCPRTIGVFVFGPARLAQRRGRLLRGLRRRLGRLRRK